MEPVFGPGVEAAPGSGGAPASPRGRHGVVEGKGAQVQHGPSGLGGDRGIPRPEGLVREHAGRRWPTLQDVLGDAVEVGHRSRRQGIFGGYLAQVLGKMLLEEAAEVVRRRLPFVGGPQRQEATAVHDLEARANVRRGGPKHAGKEEDRRIVGYDGAGAVGEGREKTSAHGGCRGWRARRRGPEER